MKFIGIFFLAVGLAFTWYFLLFFEGAGGVTDIHGGKQGDWMGVAQRSGLIISLSAAMLGGLVIVLAKYLPKSFKKPTA